MTVSSGPRTWSSYTNVNNHNHNGHRLSGMNSVQELSSYNRTQPDKYAVKTAATTYDFPENPTSGPRKDKKWSFGSLFRRKKRDGSESSSDGGDSKNFLTRRRKKKTEKKKRSLVAGNFDHIVPTPQGRYYTNGCQEDVGVLSDPSGGFSSYSSRPLPRIPQQQVDSLPVNSSYSVGSSESAKRSRRDRHRLRSTRNNIDSSSDDDSQSSTRLKSDESLVRSRDGSASRKSRAARTERYIRRLSKDEENILNREAAILQARTGIPTEIAVSTIPPSSSYKNRHSNSQTSLEGPLLKANYFGSRSISYEANIHRSPINLPTRRTKNLSLGNPHIEAVRYPPTPPPRDPKRIIPQETRPISTYYNTTTSYQNSSHLNRLVWNQNNRSNSEDHIAIAEQQNPIVVPRPSSAQQAHFQYLAEKKPRSRRPIVIQSNERINQNRNDEVKQIFTAQTHVRTNIFLPSCLNSEMSSSPNCMMGVDTVDCLPKSQDVYQPRQLKNSIYSNISDRSNSPFKPISSPIFVKDVTSSVDSLAEELIPNTRRKSTNLEEALDELEAIYKSLHLGDEDLLERAEQREMSAATKKLIDSKAESYPGFVYNKDTVFTYEPFDSVDSINKKRLNRRSQTIDRKNDDMAFRKMTRERSSTIGDPSSVISYLLTSPVHGSSPQELIQDEPRPTKEPDITLDDVVFRTIKHANGSLKVAEPQPFGIPIGPISTAQNSDYLHAIPDDDIPRYSFHRRRIPDVVKDDLAYRNLRKELNSKEPVFKNLVPEDVENNNADMNVIKKKRAIRSLSANITNLIQKDSQEVSVNNGIDDVADAMEIARQILKEKEDKIALTNRAFMSDTETKYRKDSIGESRLNFLNTMKSKFTDRKEDKQRAKHLGDNLESKPPKSTTPERRCVKELTPTPHSPSPLLTRQDSVHSSLEELLTAFAVEARETSDRITSELLKLDEDVTKICMPAKAREVSSVKKTYSNIAKEDDFSEDSSFRKAHKRSNSNKSNKVTFSEDICKPPVALPRKSPNKDASPKPEKRNIKNDATCLNEEINKVAIVTARIVNTPTKEIAIINTYKAEEPDTVEEKINTINQVADHAKQCEGLIESIIDCANAKKQENESIPESIEVINMESKPAAISSKYTKSINDSKSAIISNNESEDVSEHVTAPEHDYANISDTSDMELPMIDDIIKEDARDVCKSPFEEHKAELIASFQELGKMIDEACSKTEEAISSSKEDIRETPEGERNAETSDKYPLHQYKAESEVKLSSSGYITGYKSHCTIFVPNYNDFSDYEDSLEHNINDSANNSYDCEVQATDLTSIVEEEHECGELLSLESLKSPKLVSSTLCNPAVVNPQIEPEVDNFSQFTSLESEVEINNTVDKIPSEVSNGLGIIKAFKEANVSSSCQNRPFQYIDNLELDDCERVVNETFDKQCNKPGSSKFVDNLDVDDFAQPSTSSKTIDNSKFSSPGRAGKSSQRPCTDDRDNYGSSSFNEKQRPWYCDPMLLAVACYYAIACSYQLATLDAVTLLGLVFVIVSVIAALIL